MTVPRPFAYLDWVPSGNPAYIQQPSSGQAATGWTLKERPPFEYMNYLTNLTDAWIQYFDYVLTGGAAGLAADTTVLATTGDIAIGSNAIANLAANTNLQNGMQITGTGVDTDTYLVSFSGANAVMSKPALSNQTADSLTFQHAIATGAYVQLQLDELDASLNEVRHDPSKINAATTVYTSTGTTTSGSANVTGLGSTSTLRVGMRATGTGIPVNSYIKAILSGTSVELNRVATASASVSIDFVHVVATGTTVQAQLDELDAFQNGVRDRVTHLTSADSPYTLDTTTSDNGESGVTLVCDTSGGAIQINLQTPANTCQGFQVDIQTNGSARTNAVTVARVAPGNLNTGTANFVIRTNYSRTKVQWSRTDNSWFTSLPRTIFADDGTAAAPTYTFVTAVNKGMYLTASGIGWATGGVRRMELEVGNLHTTSGFSSETDGNSTTPAYAFTNNNSGMFNDGTGPGFIASGGADTLVRAYEDGIVSGDLSSPIRWQKFTGTAPAGVADFSLTLPVGSTVLGAKGRWKFNDSGDDYYIPFDFDFSFGGGINPKYIRQKDVSPGGIAGGNIISFESNAFSSTYTVVVFYIT